MSLRVISTVLPPLGVLSLMQNGNTTSIELTDDFARWVLPPTQRASTGEELSALDPTGPLFRCMGKGFKRRATGIHEKMFVDDISM